MNYPAVRWQRKVSCPLLVPDVQHQIGTIPCALGGAFPAALDLGLYL